MLTPDQYLQVVTNRIHRSGGRLSTVQLGPVSATVGLFTESPAVSTMNYCVAVAACPEVSAQTLTQFATLATQHGRANAQGALGWTAASIVFAGLIGHVHPDAATAASAKTPVKFGVETRLVAVDPHSAALHTWPGGKFWGALLQRSVNARLRFCFPPPAEALEEWQAFQRTAATDSGSPTSTSGSGGFPGRQIPPDRRPHTPPPPAAGPPGPQPPHYPPPGLPPYGH
ncbi:hypothetical protein ACWEOE_02215 [Amycolatopsis sp. NPDC004368]